MKSKQWVSLLMCSSLSSLAWAADDADIPTIEVVGEKVTDVNVQAVKSADLAEALSKEVAGVSLVRRSGIANDIILRGQKKDNINVLIDNGKIHGACPNRMDPPTSHILNNNIDQVEVTEGPYDVENFGTLSGAVKITTRKPQQDFQGSVSLNLGSWDYQKFALSLSGGSEAVQASLSLSQETSGQYEDGDGNNFADQIKADNSASMARYKAQYENMDAYDKSTLMAKVFADIAENQTMELSYTANRSDDVLYPSSPMDALYDDSDIVNLDYQISDLGDFSKMLELQVYDSRVKHPMSTFYRMSSAANSANEKINSLKTHDQGIKLINELDILDGSSLKFGMDFNTRNWNGAYQGKGTAVGITGIKSIPDVDTDNQALFIEIEQNLDDLNLKYGARLDDTTITPEASSGRPENDYSSVSAFVFASLPMDDANKFFAGIGKASRVPDGRELYLQKPMMGGMLIGTPSLKETTNTEIDLGIEHRVDGFNIKVKLFYSMLDDFIHYNASKTMQRFDNVDATIYGLNVNGGVDLSADLSLDFGLAYQRGEKDQALPGQTDTDLAEIPPMKMNAAFNYHYQKESTATVEMVAADSWSNFDADNGEQKLDSWAVLNVKVKHQFDEQFGITAGIDNLLDKTYAVSNTYKDLTLLSDGTGEVMLMNEPGRTIYLNAVYSF